MAKSNDIPDFVGMLKTLKKDAVRYASRAGVNFFQDSFYNQGFTDRVHEPWVKRANDVDPGRNILIQSAGLLNSIQVFSASGDRIEFGSDEAQAEIHNEGGTIKIPITARSRKYFWFMYSATGRGMWKALALTQKDQIVIKMPQRQFIGHSETFMAQLDDWLVHELKKRFTRL